MPDIPEDWIVPDWPLPRHVRSIITTRAGGTSTGPYSSMNLGTRVDDDPASVAANRAFLRRCLPSEPAWLQQVHGNHVKRLDEDAGPADADAAVTRTPGRVCAVMVADCLPVLLADRAGSVVAAAHAGWRGLSGGVIENTVGAMAVPPGNLVAYLGPAIGPRAFEVGADVRSAFLAGGSDADSAFVAHAPGKWLADLFRLARQRLKTIGVGAVYGGGSCTYSDSTRFFSHRRDKVTGRMAALIWIES
jgi:YfiH family protein